MYFLSRLLACLLFFYRGNCLQTTGHREDVHELMTPSEKEFYFGTSAKNPEYVITDPVISNIDGEIISDKLSLTRLLDRDNVDKGRPLVFFLAVLDKKMLLNVTKNKNILAPDFTMETKHENGRTSKSTPDSVDHYIGNVVSQPGSTVALTNMNGNELQGMIKLKDEVIFLYPLAFHLRKRRKRSLGDNPHITIRETAKRTSKGFQGDDTEKDSGILSTRRQRRSTAGSTGTGNFKYLQAVLVADKYLTQSLGRPLLSSVLPTLGNIIAGLFLDNSFGEIKIHYVLNKIIFLENDELSYSPDTPMTDKLHEISRWSKTADAGLGEHIDVVTLLTHGSPRGRAYIGSICSGNTPTSNVVGLSGINSAAQNAHEIGHNLGVPHDGESAECPDEEYIMATSVPAGAAAFTWSSCSRKVAQEFLNSEESSCFDDPPIVKKDNVTRTTTPGATIDVDRQCALQYDPSYRHCSGISDMCESLYCTNDGSSCVTHFSPPLDGTRCGTRRWCIKGQCVDDGSPIIDGEWGAWSSEYGPCSRTCGGGVRTRSRKCDNPSPANGGEDCEGSKYGHHQMCNTEACPEGSTSFRQQQCAAKGDYEEYLLVEAPCSLVCRSGGSIYWLGKAKDGTKCYEDRNNYDICIEGQCKEVGCDRVLQSGKAFDRCRVCGGDGSSCSLQTVNYTENYRDRGFRTPDSIVTLPSQSTNIVALQRSAGYNMIGVQTIEGEYIISLPTWSKSVTYAGSAISYIHEDNKYNDMITIDGPTTQPLKLVYVYLYGKNKGIDIKYYIPSAINQASEYTWIATDWTECSRTCAAGFQMRDVKCVRIDDQSDATVEKCTAAGERPENFRTCNTQHCDPEWYVTDWQPCSLSCGKGNQIRTITCRQKVHGNHWLNMANDSVCAQAKPEILPLQRACSQVACPPVYKPLEWSQCSTTCGPGVITRNLQCVRRTSDGTTETLPDYWCEKYKAMKLATSEQCNMDNPCQPPVSLGCFELDDDIFSTVLASFQTNLESNDAFSAIGACAELAHDEDYKYFGLTGNGECRVGPGVQSNFYKAKLAPNCTFSSDNRSSIAVYSSANLNLMRLGCYKDRPYPNRAMPTLIKSYRDQVDWNNMGNTVNQCAHTIFNAGYSYFGIQFYGECWTSVDANNTYNEYGTSKHCWEAVGQDWTNMVYTFV